MIKDDATKIIILKEERKINVKFKKTLKIVLMALSHKYLQNILYELHKFVLLKKQFQKEAYILYLIHFP